MPTIRIVNYNNIERLRNAVRLVLRQANGEIDINVFTTRLLAFGLTQTQIDNVVAFLIAQGEIEQVP